MNPKISIITTSFNSALTIEDTLLSVSNQSYKNYEHIIIDNCSNDGTKEIVAKYNKAIFISAQDQGTYFAMNFAMTVAKGEFIFFLNSDDWLSNSNILRDISLKLSLEIDCLFGNILIVNNFYPFKVFRVWRFKEGIFRNNRIIKTHLIPHPSFFIRKSVARKIGAFNTNLKIASDYEFISKALKYVDHKRIYFLDEYVTVMRRGGLSSKNVFAILQANIELILEAKFSFSEILKKIFRKLFQINLKSVNRLPPSFTFFQHTPVDLSVALVYFDTNSKVLLRTINSVLLSKGIYISIYVINNSLEPLPKEILANHKIHILNTNKNIGFGAAHNLVIHRISKSGFHLCLNPDVSFNSKLLSNLISTYKQGKMGFLIPRIVDSFGRFHYSFRSRPTIMDLFLSKFFGKKNQFHNVGAYPVDCVSGCFIFSKTSLIKKLGGFDERFFLYMEDVDISMRMSAIRKNYYCSNLCIEHQYERGSSKSIYLFLLHFTSVLKFLAKKY